MSSSHTLSSQLHQASANPPAKSTSGGKHSVNPAAVSQRMLLALYAVIPITLLIAAVDTWALNGYLLQNYLPSNPASLLLWAIIFNFPHIISSFITLADDEYIPYYRRRFALSGGYLF